MKKIAPLLINVGSQEVQTKLLQLGEQMGGKVEFPIAPFTIDGGFAQLSTENKLVILNQLESGAWFIQPSEEEASTGTKKFIQIKQSKFFNFLSASRGSPGLHEMGLSHFYGIFPFARFARTARNT